jgi:triacylglycerol lipase
MLNCQLKMTTRNPVVLVHGFKDTGAKLRRMEKHLTLRGWSAYCITLSPSWGELGIDELAGQLNHFISETLGTGKSFDLVGFSMGGLVARYYVQRLGGIERVQRFITISSPHRGTWMAHLRRNPGCAQMLPESPFLRELNADAHLLNRLQFTSIWTPLDLMIIPAWSSRIGIGREIMIPMPAHPLMVLHKRCIRAVERLLAN